MTDVASPGPAGVLRRLRYRHGEHAHARGLERPLEPARLRVEHGRPARVAEGAVDEQAPAPQARIEACVDDGQHCGSNTSGDIPRLGCIDIGVGFSTALTGVMQSPLFGEVYVVGHAGAVSDRIQLGIFDGGIRRKYSQGLLWIT